MSRARRCCASIVLRSISGGICSVSTKRAGGDSGQLTIRRGLRPDQQERLMTSTRSALIGSLLVASLAIATPVFAGPPLLCFPFETGGAKTLPMKGGNWKDIDPNYDVSHLAADTLALLTPSTPVV